MKMIITPNKFALLIEETVKTKKMSYIDAILLYCEKNGIDPSDSRKLVNKALKEKLTYEAQNLNLLNIAKVPQLPI
jgi:hypothetical protein|tara:strand:- start:257 stop:484 length:228 start_codon:yes stop_codon:yes gene_type:complete